MVRKTIISVLLASLLAVFSPWEAYPLGLGELKLNSALNQPLQAEIKLHAVRETSLENIQVSLASREAFLRAGVEPNVGLGRLRFRPEHKESGEAVVEITSQDPIRDPFLEFLVTVTWPQGRLLRAYTILLDPPSLSETRPSPGKTLAVSTRRASALPPSQKAEAMTLALQPESDTGGGAASTVIETAPTTYGPTTPADTLWPLAQRLRPQSSITPQQMMLALQRANPEAFLHNNLNGLIVGRMLNVPPAEEVLRISREEAVQQVRQQNEAWKALFDPEPAVENRVDLDGRKKAAVLNNESVEENKGGEALAGNFFRAAVPVINTAGSEISAAEHLLSHVHEALEIRTQENKILQTRLQALEQQLATLQQRFSDKFSSQAVWRESGVAVPGEEDILNEPQLVASPWESALGVALEELEIAARSKNVPAGGGSQEISAAASSANRVTAKMATAAPIDAERPRSEVDRPPSLLSVFSELRRLLLLGGGSLLLLALVIVRRRNRQARLESIPVRRVGPIREITLKTPTEVLNKRLVTPPPEAEEVKFSDETVSTTEKKQGQVVGPLSGDILLRREAELPVLSEEVLEFLSAEGESASEAQTLAVEAAELEFDLGEITSERNSLAENGQADFGQGSGEGSVLEFDLSEFSLGGESAPEAEGEEVETEDLEFNLGEIASFSRRSSTEGEVLEAEEEGALETEQVVSTVVASANRDSVAADCRPQVESSGQELMDDVDEMEIKLDLARAYMEMGSPQEACGILEEVIVGGDQRQQSVGQELLTKLARVS